MSGGFSRIDIRKDNSGCDVVWTSTEKSPPVVPKMSAGNGLLYLYTFTPQDDGENAWYLTALDAENGKTAFKIRTGVGRNFDNNWSPITLGPDGTAYVGTFKGLVAVWDNGPKAEWDNAMNQCDVSSDTLANQALSHACIQYLSAKFKGLGFF